MNRGVPLLIAACIALPGSVWAKGTVDLSTCMWTRMPTSSAAFVDNHDRERDFSLMMKAVAPCSEDMPANLPLAKLKKQLAATRPAAIGADQMSSDNVSVCERGSGGTPACKPAGE